MTNQGADSGVTSAPKCSAAQTTQWLAFLGGFGISPKLSVSTPGDADEREADAVADRVMRMTAPATAPLAVSGFAGSALARACGGGCGSDDDDRRIARKADTPHLSQAAAHQAATIMSSGGRPLGESERTFFEPRFGRDFGAIRIHTGSTAHKAATGIGALAYTLGRDIAFADGQYRPDTPSGRQLLAHELAHTVQQGKASPRLYRKIDLAACLNQTDDILPPKVGLLTVIAREQELAAKLGGDYEPLKQLIKLNTSARELVCNHGVPGVLALASTRTGQGVLDVPAATAKLAGTTVPPAPAAATGPVTPPAAGPADFVINREGKSGASRIFFGRTSSTLDADDQLNIDVLKAIHPPNIRLLGYASADESAAIAQVRADTVKAALEAAPNPVTVTSAVGDAAATASRKDFSGARSVEILIGAAAPATTNCAEKDASGNLLHPPKQPCTTMDPPTWTSFQSAHATAKDAMAKAEAAVAGTPSSGDTALIDRFFGGHDATILTTLQTNLGKLSAQVANLDSRTDCGGECDAGGCDGSAIAYNVDVDAASRMTLCVPVFKSLSSDADRVRNLIHETAHGTTPLGGNPSDGTRDVAYRHERMMFELPPVDRLRNSDSYALFALYVRETKNSGDPAAAPAGIGTPATDTLPYTDKEPEKPALKLALAKLEKRLTWGNDWSGQLYGQILKIRDGSLTWTTSWADALMTEAARHFPLTAPPAMPSRDDQLRVAAIAERYRRMVGAAKKDLTVSRLPSGIVAWDGPAAGTEPWLAGTTLGIGPDFFRASPDEQVALLFEQLAKATKDVETTYIPAYIALAKWINDQNP